MLSCLKKTERIYIDLLSIPQSRGEMTKYLGGIIGCKDKTSNAPLFFKCTRYREFGWGTLRRSRRVHIFL